MGKGCAATAKQKWPNISKELAKNLITIGNIPTPILTSSELPYDVLSFPVKPRTVVCNENKTNVVSHMRKQFKPGAVVPGWASVADLNIIKNSAEHLVNLAEDKKYKRIVIPRPGCGAGELNWELVKNVISPILDNRFYIITFPPRGLTKTHYHSL